ncbi:MAG: hypoxanthine phosphoribosyltransferase [Candidatus Amulumruptor caecigallinarius]|nr:hypoxanthine phosphoribosyltransferase [Candidatus Amulumruptor caecigallinarius]MCM1396239.1 hypoxanthine phosphoribosyltransferase [Candidatus Amulumruptor caecigallinarius]MCM1453761.1 hypoxanthine phosphoribosyltransferase [bacterium]
MKRVTYKGLTFEPYIESHRIAERINQIGKEISLRFEGKVPLLICVLNGAFPFAADLFRSLDIDAEITFIRLKSYEGMSGGGAVKEIVGLSEDIEGRDVIVVEDIIDTGNTMAKLLRDLKERNPASVSVATLLYKPEAVREDINPDYVGFTIPSKFIIGFGLDLDGIARNLRDIYVLSEHAGESQC